MSHADEGILCFALLSQDPQKFQLLVIFENSNFYEEMCDVEFSFLSHFFRYGDVTLYTLSS